MLLCASIQKPRYAIRSTWGSVKLFRQWRLHLVFLLGIDPTTDPNSHIEQRLRDESEEFGDMVMGNFVDSYRNLTYKHLMGYKWVSTFCPTAKFILKSDDDIYADIFQIIDVLLMELINARKTYACLNMWGAKPNRTMGNRWYIPKEVFPSDTYPDYCSGSAYLMRADDASKIYSISNRTKFFWVDDVFVTGVLREKYDEIADSGSNARLEILSFDHLYHLDAKTELINWCSADLSTNQLNYHFVLLDDENFIRDMYCMWNKVRLMRFAMNLGST
ncbi:beta-1,3-galactosyltransferase 1-like [Bradysia coprophila]|uniref:beta-1,3-galactosyltransferase 1-like n=1 Tax=Bradysia coprophila TaxID=38358 RepID=UPI00187D7587|nr:beta-1,3-galactosyltransferase 1-like [Bradysia coprophila]